MRPESPPEIRCIDCGATNATDRERDGVHEIACPDCGAVFGWKNLPRKCGQCGRSIWSKQERGVGICSTCVVASWTAEKREAMRKLIGLAFRDPLPSDEEKDAAIDEAFRHLDPATDSEVYSRPECIFNYCPNPETCKADDRCVHPARGDT